MLKTNIAVLVSGGGTNLQALIDAQRNGIIKSGIISAVVSSNPNAYALERAKKNNINVHISPRREFGSQEEFEDDIISALEKYNIDLIVLAGFMCILSENFTKRYENKIINVHPSLIPSFCGKGYYGIKVHEAALAYGVKVSGATVHFVNEVPDGGKIILQRAVDVEENDTPDTLQKRIMEQAEWIILPRAAEIVAKKIMEEKNESVRN